MALDKGAQAVIFDVSDDANAAAEVSARTQLRLHSSMKICKTEDAHRNVTLVFLCLSLPAFVSWTTREHTQLRETDSLPRPVVLVEAEDAEELMGLVNKNEEAKVRIEIMVEQPRWVSTETWTHTSLSLSVL